VDKIKAPHVLHVIKALPLYSKTENAD